MQKTYLYLIIGIISGYILGYIIGKFKKYKEIKQHRKEAVKKSRSIILGEVAEKILPIMKEFPYNPKDMVFIGKGIDYLIFDGLSLGNLKQIIFLEIKTGKSKQNKNEKQIEKILKKGKIIYKLVKL